MKKTLLSFALATLVAPAFAGDWDEPQDPFPIYGNVYYVGPHGISALLVTSPQGHILLDGATPKSPDAIAAHVRQLGFKVEDIKYILTSHEHFDHAGGIAALQKLTGATVIGSAKSVPVLASGKPNPGDPQFAGLPDMTPVANTRVVQDGDVIKLGPLALTAHYTPGHTQGGLSWTWQATENGRTVNMVYADSLNAIGAKGFRYDGDQRYPGAKADLERSIAKVAGFRCDLLVSVHPEQSDLWERKEKAAKQGSAAYLDPAACRSYAEQAKARLTQRLADEAKAPR
ncbi:subclass B3 metallo-beta-lactamase [Massilia sp. YMA4]|uniref:subclass B3 metallo-beta-lactamase n=1 Tax=Massilia sp. YMA4 TaxID=1593482 RepID=UPI000DD15EC2|nr:subclass B3 metallo-beta-lactamase [Massilia sp. YMA4]AXA91227.1 subclass B3 metallo-beta-lactamase [Massilia sp. YMA4]